MASEKKFKIPFVAIGRQFENLEDELHEVFSTVGRSGSYILGEKVAEFEKEFANYCGSNYAIGVGNGSDALFLTLKALEIGEGDEIITVANSFIATAWVIVATGAKPVFVDVKEDLNIDVEKIKQKITKKTKAIIPVHLAGRPADIGAIREVVDHNIYVIEDAAQAVGAKINGRSVGSLGDAAGFSLHPLKNLGVLGDGGMITTDSEKTAERLRLLRNHGLKTRDECVTWGYNSRLDSLQAAIGLVKLKYLPKWTDRNREIANYYNDRLKDKLVVPIEKNNELHVYHNFIAQTCKRNELLEYLDKNGVECKIHYPIPLHLQPCAKNLNYSYGDLPNTEELANKIISLPIYPELSDAEVETVVELIRGF